VSGISEPVRRALLDTLNDLRQGTPCRPTPTGCTAHAWEGEDACPHLRARMLADALASHVPIPPYTHAVLLAVMRGLVIGEQAHALVRVNGHKHHARLETMIITEPGQPVRFSAKLACGDLIAPIDPADVLELDVHNVGLAEDQARAIATMLAAEELDTDNPARPEGDREG